MSAASQTDVFADVWRKSVNHKFNTGTGLNIPRPKDAPRVSIFATHELAHADKPFLTWKPELMLYRRSAPDVRRMQQTLVTLLPGDNFEQLEKIYQYEYAVAELKEYHEVRLAKANTELEEWRHVAEEGGARFDALRKRGGDYAAVAWHDALLDRAQGRVVLWADIVAQEQKRVQQQKTRVDELYISAYEAVALLKQRKESMPEQGRNADEAWFAAVYLTARENAEISVSGHLT
ncbi:hypothetical protein QM012_008828 [Aureobasidium pullulans]|uniref:Uncharacterized protein n=1 Tax=Aureobasidium pullulans TaxID=5580 RepID=A0ABR0THR1_AURPU